MMSKSTCESRHTYGKLTKPTENVTKQKKRRSRSKNLHRETEADGETQRAAPQQQQQETHRHRSIEADAKTLRRIEPVDKHHSAEPSLLWPAMQTAPMAIPSPDLTFLILLIVITR